MKVKIFSKINSNPKVLNFIDLENEINEWLEQNKQIKIIKIKQSSNGGSWNNTKLVFSVWYEENN